MLQSVGLTLSRAVYYVTPQAMTLWDRGNTQYGVRETGSLALFRRLASPRLRFLGYQTLVRRWVVRTLSQKWQQAYAADVPTDGVGGGLLIVGEKVG